MDHVHFCYMEFWSESRPRNIIVSYAYLTRRVKALLRMVVRVVFIATNKNPAVNTESSGCLSKSGLTPAPCGIQEASYKYCLTNTIMSSQ